MLNLTKEQVLEQVRSLYELSFDSKIIPLSIQVGNDTDATLDIFPNVNNQKIFAGYFDINFNTNDNSSSVELELLQNNANYNKSNQKFLYTKINSASINPSSLANIDYQKILPFCIFDTANILCDSWSSAKVSITFIGYQINI